MSGDPMKGNNVIISLRIQQLYAGEEEESLELVTEGQLQKDNGLYLLTYQESELTGLAGTLTVFQIEPHCITLLRVGEFNSQMVFEEGRRHMSLYETPYGSLSVGVHTRRMRAKIGERGGEIEIDYNLEINHEVAGFHAFQIEVHRPAERPCRTRPAPCQNPQRG